MKKKSWNIAIITMIIAMIAIFSISAKVSVIKAKPQPDDQVINGPVTVAGPDANRTADDTHIIQSTTISANQTNPQPYYQVINGTVHIAGPEPNKATDDTEKIQAAIIYAGENGHKLCFDSNKTYLISATQNNQSILTVAYDNLDIDLNGSTIKLATNNYTGYNVISINNVTGIKIHNGKLQGDRLTHCYVKTIPSVTITNGGSGYTVGALIVDNTGTGGSGFAGNYIVTGGVISRITITNIGSGYSSAPVITGVGGRGAVLTPILAGTHEFGYGIYAYGSDAEIADMEIYDMTGDGIIVKEKPIDGVGTVSNSSGSASIVGSGTSFISLFKVGDAIKIGTQTAYVTALSDNTHLKTTAVTGANSNATYQYFTKSTVRISGCEIHHCRRQGISILDFNSVTIDNCYIHHIGTWDNISGTAPQSGIDCEPASGTKQIRYFELTNSTIENCTGYGLVEEMENVVLKAKIDNFNTTTKCLFKFSNLDMKNSTFNYNESGASGISWIQCTTAENCSILTSIINKNIYLYGTFINCSFKGSSPEFLNSTRLDGDYTLENCDLTDIQGARFYNNGNLVNCAGLPIYTGRANATLINNRFNNCSLDIKKANFTIDDNNVFTDCRIFVDNGVTLNINNCKFIDCDTSNNYISVVNLTGCYLKGENIFGKAAKIVNNSTIILTGINNYDTFNYSANKVKSTMINSTLKVENELADMKFLQSADTCVFFLSPANAASALPDKCTNCTIVTGL